MPQKRKGQKIILFTNIRNKKMEKTYSFIYVTNILEKLNSCYGMVDSELKTILTF